MVIISGEMAAGQVLDVFKALDAAHAKSRITIILHNGTSPLDDMAERWANRAGILSAVLEANGPDGFFAMGNSLIAFPFTGSALMISAKEHGLKVWEPFKVRQPISD